MGRGGERGLIRVMIHATIPPSLWSGGVVCCCPAAIIIRRKAVFGDITFPLHIRRRRLRKKEKKNRMWMHSATAASEG